MKKAAAFPVAPSLMLRWLREALPYLLKKALPNRAIRRLPAGATPTNGEIGMVCQFVGDLEGEMTLLASRATALAFAAAVSPRPVPGTAGDIALFKASLGGLLTVLTAKLLARCHGRSRGIRVTSPSCIYGVDLVIKTADDVTKAAGFETPFGRIGIVLSVRRPAGGGKPAGRPAGA